MVASWAFFLSDRAPSTNAALIGFPLDDAWIHQVYARSLAQEYGFHYNTGVPEGGMTSPLWVVLLAPLHLVSEGHTVRIVLGTKLLDLMFGLSGMVLLYAIALELELGELAGILAAILFAIDPSLGFARASGMEVALFIALVLLALLYALRGRVVFASAVAGLTIVARPEGVVLLPLFALAVLKARQGRQPRPGTIAIAVLLAILPAAAYSAFCLHATGQPLPNSFYAKFASENPFRPRLLAFIWKNYVHNDLPYFLFEAGTLAALLGCVRILRRAGVRGALVLGVGVVTFLAAVESRQFARGHYFYWERWIMPWTPYLLLAMAAGVEELRSGLVSLRRSTIRLSAAPAAAWSLAAGAIVLALLAPVPRALRERADLFAWNAQNIEEMNVTLGRWIDATLPANAVVAVNDAGALRYFGRRTTIDLIGLNDHRILQLERYHGLEALLRMGIDYVVVFPKTFKDLVDQMPLHPIYSVKADYYTVVEGPQDVMTVYQMAKP